MDWPFDWLGWVRELRHQSGLMDRQVFLQVKVNTGSERFTLIISWPKFNRISPCVRSNKVGGY